MIAASATPVPVRMNVVGSMGGIIGTTRKVRAGDFLIERILARNVYVPFRAVRTIVADLVQLDILADQVDEMRWGLCQLELWGRVVEAA